MCVYVHRNVHLPSPTPTVLLYDNRKQNKTSGPIGRVLYLTPLTKRQKFHLALLLPSRLTHVLSHPHRELSVDETPPGSGNSGVNGKAVAFAFKEFMVGGRKPAEGDHYLVIWQVERWGH